LAITNIPQQELFNAPLLQGSITLDSGNLKILNKELRIQRGNIQFLHSNLNDPLVDLVARNRIGKYMVTLQATGSLQKPTIVLESTPELSEEQIIGLLLTGSENSSLQNDLPAMLLQNLDSLLFANTRTAGKGQFLVDALTKTFKYVQITPNLGDTTGRSMLKGSLSLPLTERLHARIDKDLDMQKEFSGQVEYFVTDNVNLKFVQALSERGVEVEFMYKP
jgi:hypothetical protein